MAPANSSIRVPVGSDPADDAGLPEELEPLKVEAERRVAEWATSCGRLR
jgi:hypothetical protein